MEMAYHYQFHFARHQSPTAELQLIPMVTTDFAPLTSSNNRYVVTNTTCPVGKPELFTTEYRKVKNIYANTGIDPALQTPTKRGINLYFQTMEVATAVDNASENPGQPYDSPFKCVTSIQVAENDAISEEDLALLLNRHIGMLYANGLSQWARFLRGIVDPMRARTE